MTAIGWILGISKVKLKRICYEKAATNLALRMASSRLIVNHDFVFRTGVWIHEHASEDLFTLFHHLEARSYLEVLTSSLHASNM